MASALQTQRSIEPAANPTQNKHNSIAQETKHSVQRLTGALSPRRLINNCVGRSAAFVGREWRRCVRGWLFQTVHNTGIHALAAMVRHRAREWHPN